jgi:lysophospholipase L1-like esterase
MPSSATRADDPPPLALKDGDRVVLIGDALIEREQTYGHLETVVSLLSPDKTITFRNLGWSGDTPYGIARARFGKPEEGYRHLVDHVLALNPTVLIAGYGMTDSFDGEAGLPRFEAGMNRLLDDLKPTQARVVLVSPIAHEDLGRPLPDPASHNVILARYRDALRAIAQRRGAGFVDLLTATSDPARGQPLTDDGIHLNERGYALAALAIARGLGINAANFRVDAREGIDAFESLSRAVIAKDRLYFYRWRPQNETYLFGFRKHEQGNNAREIPLFDPLVDEKEREIARLKRAIKSVKGTVPRPEESK